MGVYKLTLTFSTTHVNAKFHSFILNAVIYIYLSTDGQISLNRLGMVC